jgi:hypothetical protein
MSHHHLTHKSPKIALLIEDCHGGKWDAHYLGYFRCFNGGDYYEAHDVLEELWLAEGKEGQGYDFYKGLIQIAGAFVHMKQHYYAPEHRAHGKRLAPAFRLLNRACDLTRPFLPEFQDLDLRAVHGMAGDYARRLESGTFQINPWHPEQMPKMDLRS